MQVKPRLETVPVIEDRYILWSKAETKQVSRFGSDTSFYASMKEQNFPLPVKIGRRSFWRKTEVLEWIDNREHELDVRAYMAYGCKGNPEKEATKTKKGN